jgi:endonuclease/exonuclease/phosphatase family metal-dependent hydrolase
MLRVATWNINFGNRLPLVLEGVAELPRFDLITLQELSHHHGEDDAIAIARRLGPSWRAKQVTAQVSAGRVQANGFVWDSRRVEEVHSGVISLPTPSGRVMRSLPPSRRNAVVMDASVGNRPLRIYGVHLDVLGIDHKHAQFAHVLDDASGREPAGATLIAGDLNTYGVGGRPRWTELRRLAGAAGFEELTTGIGWTRRRLGVRQKLDAVYASPRGLPHHARRVVMPGSDHMPVLVELDRW